MRNWSSARTCRWARRSADFFVREDIGLSNEVTVIDAGRGDGVVYATVVQTEEPAAGQLTIILGDQPRELREWRAVDAQGYQTQVALTGLETGRCARLRPLAGTTAGPQRAGLTVRSVFASVRYCDPLRRRPVAARAP